MRNTQVNLGAPHSLILQLPVDIIISRMIRSIHFSSSVGVSLFCEIYDPEVPFSIVRLTTKSVSLKQTLIKCLDARESLENKRTFTFLYSSLYNPISTGHNRDIQSINKNEHILDVSWKYRQNTSPG